MLVLVVNTGSSSLKYKLYDLAGEPDVRASGTVERIGEPDGPPDHAAAVETMTAALAEAAGVGEGESLGAVGHRVVHGGEEFVEPTAVDDNVLETLRELTPLAPLHTPPNVSGIEAMRARYPQVPQVAVFDTAFHRTLPPYAYRYALPTEIYEKHRVRRYGFHGSSVSYVVKQAAEHLGKPVEQLTAIVAHLGNGASITAVERGRSVDTSMGLTPLEGLVMGTRSGDLDPAAVLFLAREAGATIDDLDTLLNKRSGLKGLAGANDMREVERRAAAGDESARLALDVYVYRIRKYVGAYTAVLGRPDALVFTAGVGENSAGVRRRVCAHLDHLGIELDDARNEDAGTPRRPVRAVHSAGSPVAVLVVRTDEELEIALQSQACLAPSGQPLAPTLPPP